MGNRWVPAFVLLYLLTPRCAHGYGGGRNFLPSKSCSNGPLEDMSAGAVAAAYDVAVVGGGIVGLATARELLARGAGRVAVLEREAAVAQHQTGHNSGVIHAGLYYKPGSLKARLCLKGMRMAYGVLAAVYAACKKVYWRFASRAEWRILTLPFLSLRMCGCT